MYYKKLKNLIDKQIKNGGTRGNQQSNHATVAASVMNEDAKQPTGSNQRASS